MHIIAGKNKCKTSCRVCILVLVFASETVYSLCMGRVQDYQRKTHLIQMLESAVRWKVAPRDNSAPMTKTCPGTAERPATQTGVTFSFFIVFLLD